jgi:Tfp pilus assembly protein PilP
MKLTTTILVCVLGVGLGWAQNPTIIQNTRNTMNAVRDTEAGATAAALGASDSVAPAKASAASPASTQPSPMEPRPAKAGKKAHTAIHKDARSKPPLVEQKTTAPMPGTSASSTSPADAQESEDPAAAEKAYNPTNRRDPFLSPVVSHNGNSGCSTGKKCLEIGAISLHGVVRAENGFIAVVSNGQNKAYFLRENDPVFNGYVVKITDDSIVFQETLQDRLGKSFTREVVKKITAPAV